MSLLPPFVRSVLEDAVGPVRSARGVGGGDVSRAARVGTSSRTVFVKWGRGDAGKTYPAEAAGLEALSRAAGPGLDVPVPVLHRAATDFEDGLLVLPWLEGGTPSRSDWSRFGAALAELHRADADGGGYGWDADNWVGSKPQRNGWLESWPEFFGERRLRAQAEVVRRRRAWDPAWDEMLDRVVGRLDDLLPARPPRSLVHGDLWAGNALALEDGFALIDPAVYVGHREVDLAMTELFGGFPAAFYGGYREAWPLEAGYAERREVYNLFHLTNHLTHGPGYRRPVEVILRRFA
ncbi:fructosamine kinase family protein [Rubrivirga sp.]|uniref:fructosamine kinase family protein n=1 Tax=Rubrivirga sp. TaxID=1885344 RepID=UPI003C74C0B5